MHAHIEFIRHGKTPANSEKRYIGRTDESLSEEGIRDLKLLGENCSIPDMVFSSPMKRCLESCEILFSDFNGKIRIIDSFREVDFGEFEMKNYEELKDDSEYQLWIDSNGERKFPGGESRGEFIERCMEGFGCVMSEIKDYYKISGRDNINVSLVVHGGTIMSILSYLMKDDYYGYQCRNAEGYSVEIDFDERNADMGNIQVSGFLTQ